MGVLEAGVDAGRPYLVLPLVEGGSLAGLLEREGPLQPRRAAELVDRVALAVDHAHAQGVVHRDLKPGNVLLDAEGAPLVTDLGIARDAEAKEQLTRTGALMGTPSYMAPEQAAGETSKVGPRTDVYALGAILYELLCGAPPFVGATPMNVVNAVLTREPVPVHRVRPELPRDLAAIVQQALAKAPEDRYDSAAALAADLRRWLDGRPVLARRLGRLARAGRWAARHPVLALAATALVLGAWATLVAAGARAVDDARHRGRVARAEQAAEAGDAAGARAAWGDVARARPGDERAWEEVLGLARAAQDLAGARAAAEGLVAAAPGRADAWALLAELALERGPDAEPDPGRAATAGALALARGADAEPVRVRLAEARLALGDARGAVAALPAATSPAARRARARAWAELGCARAAARDRWAALAEDPTDAASFAALVRARLDAGDALGAARTWEDLHRELAAPGAPPLLLARHDGFEAVLAALASRAPGPAATRARLCGAIAAPLAPRSAAHADLAAFAAGDDPLLAEAAAGSLVLAGVWAPARWATRAAAASAAEGAPQAVTLLEQGPALLAAVPRLLDALVEARGPALRQAVALTAARPFAGAAGDAALARLARDPDERVRATAALAAAARRLLGPGAGATTGEPPPAAAYALAARLAEPAEALLAAEVADEAPLDAARAAVVAALEATLARAPDPARAALAARLALEDGRLQDARAHAARAAPSVTREVAALLAALARAPDADAAAAAAREVEPDPVAREELEARLAAARELGLLVVPLGGEAVRAVLHATDEAATRRACALDASWIAPDGPHLVTQGVVTLRPRFELPFVHGVRLDLRHPGPAVVGEGALAALHLHPLAGGRYGRGALVATAGVHGHVAAPWRDGTPVTRPHSGPGPDTEGHLLAADGVCAEQRDDAPGERPSCQVPDPLAGVHVRVDRVTALALVAHGEGPRARAMALGRVPTALRDAAPTAGLHAEWGWNLGPSTLARLVVDGAFPGGAPRARWAAASATGPPARRLAPAAGTLAFALARADRAGVAAAPRVPLARARADGLALPAAGGFVAGEASATVAVLEGLRGAFRLQARPRASPATSRGWLCGLAVRRAGAQDRAFVMLYPGAPPWAPSAAGIVSAVQQFGVEWELPVHLRPLPRLDDVTLRLERAGDRVAAAYRAGEDGPWTALGRALEVDFPDPVEALLFARGDGSARVAFDRIELEVEPPD